jgi:hypothetical protein
MVYKTNPIDLLVEFDTQKKYRLGDTIDATITLMPNSGTNIRKASLDLVLEERFTEVSMGRSMGGGGAGALQGGNAFKSTDYVAMQQTTSSKSSAFVHSSVQFLGGTALEAGQSTYKVALPIKPSPPKRLAESQERVKDSNSSITFHWRLEAKVDVVRGRNPKVQRKVNIDLT